MLSLISEGPPRPIEFTKPRVPDFVVFTDGSFPDGSEGFPNVPWIGGVLFQKGAQPLQFGAAVDFSLIETWIPRKSQIAMVEFFATRWSLCTHFVRG